MYLAAGTAVAGMIGGLTGIGCGAILDSLHGLTWVAGGWTLTGFHLLFLVSTGFRLGAIALARQIHEPDAQSITTLVWHLASGAVPPAPAHWGELAKPESQAGVAAMPVPTIAASGLPSASVAPGKLFHVDPAPPTPVPSSHLPPLLPLPTSGGAVASSRASPH
jgi:hypothetical protein